ncbi:MAG: efflux RND transporter permease subunit [Magnetospirillum sp.]|nr:efflux RND transporter permease subunit [Magnetospirillum sp.]
MLRRLVAFSIHFRAVILILACVLIGYGVFVAAHAKLDVFPEFAPPRVVIQTEAPGLSPEEVEILVTRPIETVLNGSNGLDSLRSQSIQGISVVTAVFRNGTDIYRARQLVGERLAQTAGKLPLGVAPPTMAPLTSTTSIFLTIGLTSDKLSPMALRTFADWTLKPRLLATPGVAKAAIFGGEVRQLQIQVNPDRLVQYDLAIGDVIAAARSTTGVRGAGFIDTPAQRIVLQTEGQSLTPDQIGDIVLTQQNGVTVRLKDVARVVEAAQPKPGDAAILGRPGVVLQISSQYGANPIEVTQAVERTLDELRPVFEREGIKVYPALFRAANFIERAIHNVDISLVTGGALVAVILFLFLLNLRTAFISFTAIPLSLLAALIVLDWFGISVNTLTLGGFAIAIGLVVDDAIIDVENVWRRLRENRHADHPQPAFRIVLDATLEVRSPVVYATFIVILIFLPVLTLSGLQGSFFAPLAIASVLAVLASLGVALTVTPALCFVLLPKARYMGEPPYIQRLKALHRQLLVALSGRSRLLLGAVSALCLAALAVLPFFGGSLLPEFKEGHFIVQMLAIPGTSLDESLRVGDIVTADLLKNPHIRSVSQQVGRAESSEDTEGPHRSEFNVDLAPSAAGESDQVQAEIRQTLSRFPGFTFSVKSFLTDRIQDTISGTAAQVVVKVFGQDLDLIDQKAQEVARILGSVRGATDVQVQSTPTLPQMVVRLRRNRLQQFGFEPIEVLDAVQTAFQGSVVAQTYDGDRVFDVTVILDPNARRDPERVGQLMLRRADGTRIPLQDIAGVYSATGRYVVQHDGGNRLQIVTSNVAGRDVSSFVAEAKQKIAAEVKFPAGTYAVFAGEAEARATAQQQLLVHSSIAAIGILLLLATVIGNARNLLLVMANVPFALVGGVVAVALGGGSLSIGSLVGFVTLFGLTIRNSILLVSHYEHLVQFEGMNWGIEAALRGAAERLLPILMTALVTALGLLPIAISSGTAGHEIEGPMALVILGGLFTSTALNLLVLPILALRYGNFVPATADIDTLAGPATAEPGPITTS